MDRVEIVQGVASDLYGAEQSIDAAIAQATALVQSMIGARAELSLSPVSGAGSQAKAMEAIAALGAARAAIVACHAELQKDHRRLGWGTYAIGPLDKPDDWDQPRDVPGGVHKSHLRVA